MWRHGNFGMDDVFRPIAFAGGHIAREAEIGKGRERDIVRAADAGFEHPAAPDGNAMALAEVVDAPRHGVAADAAQFDIDDLAGAQLDGRACVLLRVNALVQADWGVQFFLQFDVAVKIVPRSLRVVSGAASHPVCRRSWRRPSA